MLDIPSHSLKTDPEWPTPGSTHWVRQSLLETTSSAFCMR